MAKKIAPVKAHESPIPAQLKRQIEEADAIRAQMEQDETSESDSPPDDDQVAEGSPPSEQAPPPPQEEQDESWEQKFRSAAGRLDQLINTNRQLHERVAHFENLVATLQAKGADAPADSPPPKTVEKLITDQERQDYGEDLLNVVGKRAREEYVPEFEQLADRIKRLEGRVEGVGKVMDRTQQQDVYVSLDQYIENWRAINKAPEFKAWLEQPDVYSGKKRHDMLQEAFSRHEAGRVVAFFQGFLSEATGLPPESSSPGPSAPPLAPNGNGSGKPSLEDFAAPGRARSAPQQLSPDKPVYTSAQIAKFFADKRVGKYRGREAQADEIERDIFQAQHEGRIQ